MIHTGSKDQIWRKRAEEQVNRLTFFPLEGIGSVAAGDNVAAEILSAADRCSLTLQTGDILVIAHKIISKAEGRQVALDTVVPTPQAMRLAGLAGKPPELVRLILDESQQVTVAGSVIICRHRLGWICANAGIDESNAGGKNMAVLLPRDPDASAQRIVQAIKAATGQQVAVIIGDTHGRPLREGITGVAVGSFGIAPLKSYVGQCDREGRKLHVSVEAIADELAGGASLLMGQGDEGIPAVVVRGYRFDFEHCGSQALKRRKEREIFRPVGITEDVQPNP